MSEEQREHSPAARISCHGRGQTAPAPTEGTHGEFRAHKNQLRQAAAAERGRPTRALRPLPPQRLRRPEPHKGAGAAPSPVPPGVPCIEALGGYRPPAVLSTTAPPAPWAARRGARARAPGRKGHSLRAGRAAPPSPLSGSPPVNRDQLPRGVPGPPAQLAAMRGTSAAR